MKTISIAAARQTIKYTVRVVEAIFIVIALAAAVFIWRLAQGPLSLDEVAPYLAAELGELAPGFAFDISRVSLSWPRIRQRPTFEISGVTIQRDRGVLATIDAMSIRLDPPSLFRGEIAVEHVGLTGLTLRLSRLADGSVNVGLSVSRAQENLRPAETNPAAGADATASPEDDSDQKGGEWLVGILAPRSAGPPGAARLDTVDFRDVTLLLDDQARGRQWTLPGAELQLLRQTSDIQMAASLPLAGSAGAASIDLAGRYIYASATLALTASFDRFAPEAIFELVSLPGESSDAPPSILTTPIITTPISGIIDGEIAFKGGLPEVRSLKFDLRAGAGTINLPARLGGSRAVASAELKGSVNADLDGFTLDSLLLSPAAIDSDPVVTLSGRASGLNSSPTIEMNASVPGFSLAALKQLWPTEVAESTRGWIDKNLHGGSLSDLKVSAAFSGPSLSELSASRLDLGVNLKGLRVHYIEGLPEVEDTSGRLTMDLRQVVIAVTHGRIPDLVSGTSLDIAGADLRMGDLTEPRQLADFTIDIKGSLGDTLRFIDRQPLEYARKMQVATEGASGNVDLRLKLEFPLIKKLRLADLKIDVVANIDKAHIENVTFGLPLDDGALKLHVTENFLDAVGTTKLGDIRAGLTWRENFSGGEFRSQYALDAILGNEHRPLVALGRAPFIPPYMDGAVRAEIVYTVRHDSTATLAAEADFTDVALTIPELNWRKAAGDDAHGHAEVLLKDGGLVAVERFQVTGGEDLKIAGRVDFGADNTLNRVAIGPSRIGGNEMEADVIYTPDGVIDAELRGRDLDVSYFWKEFSKDEARGRATEDQQPLRLKVAADRMRLTRDGAFDQVRLVFERDRKSVQKVDFSARVQSGKVFTLTLGGGAEGRSFNGESDDAGGVLRSIGLFDDIVGGELKVGGAIAPNGVVEGLAEIEGFQLVDAPLVARVLSVAALTGIADELSGSGMSFRALRVPFVYAGSTLSLKDAEMYGNSLGMTMQGNYRFRDKEIDIEGTLVPAYAINAALNRIPIVGDILTGVEKGSGIFAATYRWNGPTATSSPTVNPLAALTPGILRKFFSIFESSPAAPSAAPGPADSVNPS